MPKVFRYYQEEANNAIYEELLVNNKCIVKMFCGTGKSLLMRRCKVSENKKLVVYVFPSLPLIDQFYTDYLIKEYPHPVENMLKISSDNEATTTTTNPIKITQFLSKPVNKLICVTYQSFKTLIDNLGEIKINVCIFDEAHHAVGETYQKLIFENDFCEKQIFFTATPKNANGIVMYDREQIESGMCGKLVYDYSYLRGVNEGYLNPFEIRIDMFLENTKKSVYESIARAILSTGNNRALTFHSDVNTDRDNSVNNFVNDVEFKRIFNEILEKEFPEKIGYYTSISMVGLTSNTDRDERKRLLKVFDSTPDNQVIVISSCHTIGEGIDTKNANMCVFVDPKTSHVEITQNIGRIVRKVFGEDKPNSTILIPCWVDKSKYLECCGDKDKCDEVIRQDMSDGGNFNGILKVLSALKQEDEELYDICLHYPDTYSPQVGAGTLIETIEHLLDDEIDYENYDYCETDEEMIMNIAEDNDVCIEIHTNSLENPVERYNSECESGETIRLYKSVDEELEETIYQPIVKKEKKTKRNSDNIFEPKRENRMGIKVHTNPDIKVLWNITSDIDFTKDICSCVIDCEVVDNWYDNFEELKKFIHDNQERPTKSKNKKLTQWLFNQQTHYRKKDQGMKNELRYNEWSIFIEQNKQYFKNDDEIWNETFEELEQFIYDNKKRPTESKNKRLTQWLGDQKKYYKNKTLGMTNEIRYNKWTTFMEKNKKYLLTDNEEWNERLKELNQFIIYKKRVPSQTAKKEKKRETEQDKQEREKEKKLASWLSNQQTYYKDKILGMSNKTRYNIWTKFIDEHKKYFKNNEEIWDEKFIELKTFMEKNHKRPNTKSKNEIEAKLGYWLVDQLIDYRNIPHTMLNETRYNEWTTFMENMEKYGQYVMNDDETWKYKFALLKKFIEGNKKRPSKNSKNKLEKDLGVWMTNTNSSYKKKEKGMKDKARYNLWTTFLEEYKEYFDKENLEDTQSVASTETETKEEEEFIIPKPKKKSMKLKKSSTKPKKETTEQKRERVKSELSLLLKEYKPLKSSNLHKKFKEEPELWHNLQAIIEENDKSFPEDELPRNRVITELLKIETIRKKLVVDMGCGRGQIAEYFQNDSRFEFINYDHVSSNDTITSCDISHTPLEDNSVEICILSLAMWGSNCEDYVKEANRILESKGELYIIEPTKRRRWSEYDENGNMIEGKEGMKLKALLEDNGFQIVEQSIEKFCMFVCIKKCKK
jgi:ribosomal RNA-processing protein 8